MIRCSYFKQRFGPAFCAAHTEKRAPISYAAFEVPLKENSYDECDLRVENVPCCSHDIRQHPSRVRSRLPEDMVHPDGRPFSLQAATRARELTHPLPTSEVNELAKSQ